MKLIALTASCLLCVGGLLASGSVPQPVQAQQPTPFGRGETLFKQRCAACHIVAGKGGKLGPDLAKVVGRRAGSAAYAYSPAMKASRIVWDARTLDTYMAAPMQTVPGSKMAVAVRNPQDRAALIAYLAAQK